MNYQKMLQVIAQSSLDIPCRELAERAAVHNSFDDMRGAFWILQELRAWSLSEDLPEVSLGTLIDILLVAIEAHRAGVGSALDHGVTTPLTRVACSNGLTNPKR